MDDNPDEIANWDAVADAVARGDLDEAARLVLRSQLFPGLVRQLQYKYPRLPHDYVDDAMAEAVHQTFSRLHQGSKIDPKKIGGYIFNTARYILRQVAEQLQERGQLFDDERTPYDPDLAEGVAALGDVLDDPGARSSAIRLLASFIDVLPSSDSAKQVLKVRFDAALDGDWLTDKEVAEILGKERSSISSWWRRGLADLKEYCSDHGIDRKNLDDLADQLDELEAEYDDDQDHPDEEDGE